MLKDKTPGLTRATLITFTLIAIALSLFQLYTSGIRIVGAYYQRGIHLTLILVLVYLLFPVFGRKHKRGIIGWLIDGAFIAGSIFAGWHMLNDLNAFSNRVGFANRSDIVAGIVLIFALLEASRRVIGPTITIIAVVFILYALAGPRGELPWLGDFLPGILEHRGKEIERVVSHLYMGLEGIFGIPLGVAATVVFIFVLFGAFLEVSGAGKFFIDLAYSLAGRQRGGPAKAAVVASGFMGSISGSAIANVVTSGAFTIPLMKKLGYKPEEAAGIEAAASTGGQIMPPIMGAGAFLIAEYTKLPYIEIVKLSVLPAILYFTIVYLFVDIIAAKRGMRGMTNEELPRPIQVLRAGWYYLVPLIILVFFLLRNISPSRVGFIAVVALLVISIIRFLIRKYAFGIENQTILKATGRGVVVFFRALELGARNALPVTVACAISGVVVGIIGLTGLGLKFSALMISFSGGNLLLALLLLILASLVLGMGLPVTASYIVLAVLAAPALTHEFGIALIIAHLIIFWYSQDSNVTPPVALAAFAGAGIAGSSPMRAAVEAWKFAKGLYLIPLFFIYNPEMITGGPFWLVSWSILTALAAMGAFAVALEGFLFTRVGLPSRFVLIVGTVCIFWPSIWIELIGFVLILTVLGSNFSRSRYIQASL